jgi:hypothetical protein
MVAEAVKGNGFVRKSLISGVISGILYRISTDTGTPGVRAPSAGVMLRIWRRVLASASVTASRIRSSISASVFPTAA